MNDFIRERLETNTKTLTNIEHQLKQLAEIGSTEYLNEEQVSEVLEIFSRKDKSPDQIRAMVEMFVDAVIIKQNEFDIKLRFALDWWRRTAPNQKTNCLYFEKQVTR